MSNLMRSSWLKHDLSDTGYPSPYPQHPTLGYGKHMAFWSDGSYYGPAELGQWQIIPATFQVGSQIARLFGGGKSKAQKQAESQQRRAARAAGVFQSVANALSRFPRELEDYIMQELSAAYSTGGTGTLQDRFKVAPCSVIDAYLNAPFSGKASAVRGHQEFVSRVRAVRPGCLSDEDWWRAYQSGGVQETPTVRTDIPRAVPVSVPAPISPTIYQTGPAQPPAFMQPTQDGQAEPIKAGFDPWIWVLLAGAGVFLLSSGRERTRTVYVRSK